jgi:hypothetical protein
MRTISLRTMPVAFVALALGVGVAAAQDAATLTKAPKGAKVYIESPKDGATVGPDVTVKFGATGIAIKPAGDMTPSSGHHHLLIDQKELPPLDQPIPNDATHKHYGKAQTEDTIHLEPGKHTLQLDLGDAAHRQFDPPIVSKKITITVK